jgi:DNA-binding CsgD family transcriptional regulator
LAQTGSHLSAGRLLERDREVALLEELVDGAAEGDARLAIVEGPAGIGKTRLVTQARAQGAAVGMRVLTARGGELEREFPFGVARQLFEPLLVDEELRDRLLEGAAELAGTVVGPLSDDGAAPLGDTSFAALHGLYWLVVNLTAEGPLMLVVDDLHWCDRPSLRFLAFLSHRLEGLPAMVVGSMRPAEPGADTALLAELAREPAAVLQLGPLSAGAVKELARERLGDAADDAFSAACHEATGGNPLLLHELLYELEAEGVTPDAAHVGTVRDLGPRAASRAVLLRLARLPGEAATVARAASVLGDGTDLPAVARLAGLDTQEAAEAIGTLARADVLRPEHPIGFVHPLVRDAVYRDVPAGERALQHERAARLLADAGASAERVAAQLLEVPERGDEWVVATLRQAAAGAMRRGAPDSAVSYLSRALVEPPPDAQRGDVLRDLGLAEALTDGHAAAEHLKAVHDGIDDPVLRGWLAGLLSAVMMLAGRTRDAARVCRHAIDSLPPDQGELRRRLQSSYVTVSFFDTGAVPRSEVDEIVQGPELEEPGPGARLLQAVAAYVAAAANEPADRVVQLALDAIADGSLLETDNGSGAVAGLMSVMALTDRPEALSLCDAALADAHRRGSVMAAAPAHTYRGYSLFARGELAEAAEMIETGFEEVELWGIEVARLHPSSYLTEVLIELGDLDGAERALARAGLPIDVPENNFQMSWWIASRLRLLVAQGKLEEALAVAIDAERRFGKSLRNPAWLPWRSLKAETLDRLGRSEEALPLASEEVELARRWGAPRALGRALRVRGQIAREEGLDDLREAVEVLDGTLARLELGKALAAQGAAIRRGRKPTEAREPLRRALELASACGAEPLAEHARSELHAAGARPRSEALSGVEALSPSERRVVDLAADGRTNRLIAQELFVTPKTVEVHLTNAYRKLGIRSRRELPAALAAG